VILANRTSRPKRLAAFELFKPGIVHGKPQGMPDIEAMLLTAACAGIVSA
jgi:hypothetical protein